MVWNGYFTADGIEVINATRTEAYAKANRLSWFKPIYENTALPALVGHTTYTSPATDAVNWYEPDSPESAEFYGAYPLDVTGGDDSTFMSTAIESLTDGGTVAGSRNSTRSTVFNVALIGASEAGVEYGMQWFKRALIGACGGRYVGCTGFDLSYFASEPILGEVAGGACATRLTSRATDPATVAKKLARTLRRTQVLNGPTITAKRRTTDGGCVWTATFTVNSGSPFEFGPETMFLQDWLSPTSFYPWPYTVTDTNLAYNPNFNVNTVGMNAGDATKYPITWETAAPISGAGSARTVRAGVLDGASSSVWINGRSTLTNALPVTPNVPITASIDVKTEQASRNIQIYWAWRDAANAAAGVSPVASTLAPTAGTRRVTSTGIPPANAAFGYAIVSIYTLAGNAITGEKTWYDNLKISANPDSTYFDGGSAGCFWTGAANGSTSSSTAVTSVTATNLVTNPSSEAVALGVAGGGVSTITRDTTQKYVGAYSTKCVWVSGAAGVTAVNMNVTKPGTYAVSLWINVESGANPTINLTDQSFVSLGSINVIDGGGALVAGGGWRRVGAVVTIGANVTILRAYTLASAASTHYLDAAQVTEGTAHLPYFDGDQPGCYWTGPQNASTSIRSTQTRNLAQNPSFEGGTAAPWTTANATTAVVANPDGTGGKALKITCTTVATMAPYLPSGVSGVPVFPGETLYVSGRIRPETVGRNSSISVYYYDAAGANIPGSPVSLGYRVATSGTWNTYTGSTVVPATAAFMTMQYMILAVPVGEVHYVDQAMIYRGPESAPTYFDGDSAGSLWTGARYASSSVKTTIQKPPNMTVTGPVSYDGGDELCLPSVTVPLYDPLCPGTMSPPPPPAIEWACYTGPVNDIWNRYTVVIPRENIPGWQEVDPIIRLATREVVGTDDSSARNIRIRFYPDPLQTGLVPADPCGFDYEFIVSFIPTASVMTIDGRDEVVYVDNINGVRRRADSLIFSSGGLPPEWTGLTCDQQYVMTLDLDPAQTSIPSVGLSFVQRYG